MIDQPRKQTDDFGAPGLDSIDWKSPPFLLADGRHTIAKLSACIRPFDLNFTDLEYRAFHTGVGIAHFSVEGLPDNVHDFTQRWPDIQSRLQLEMKTSSAQEDEAPQQEDREDGFKLRFSGNDTPRFVDEVTSRLAERWGCHVTGLTARVSPVVGEGIEPLKIMVEAQRGDAKLKRVLADMQLVADRVGLRLEAFEDKPIDTSDDIIPLADD